jgi:hypothetical protein
MSSESEPSLHQVKLKNVWIAPPRSIIHESETNPPPCDDPSLADVEQPIRPMIAAVPARLLKQPDHPSPLLFRTWPLNQNFVDPGESIVDVVSIYPAGAPQPSSQEYRQWLPAGPRRALKFNAGAAVAAVVTCGGICPGMNNVVREILTTLTRTYGADGAWGVPFGLPGLYLRDWRRLNLAGVRDIHKTGGTVLGTSRAPFNAERRVQPLPCDARTRTH